MEQNKFILEKFQLLQKQYSLSYSAGNSSDGNLAADNTTSAATSTNTNNNTNSLQIPTISSRIN